MSYRYIIYNSNDLLLSAKQRRSTSIRRRLIVIAFIFGIGGCWLGLRTSSTAARPVTPPATTAPAIAVPSTPAPGASPSVSSTVISSAAISNANAMLIAKSLQPTISHVKPDSAVTIAAVKLQPPHITPPPVTMASVAQWQTITLKKGDTLGKIFLQHNLTAQQLQAVMSVKEASLSLRRLQAGNRINLLISPDNRLQQLNMALNTIDTLEVRCKNNKATAKVTHQAVETQLTYASATVSHGLAQTTRKAGIQGKLGAQLVSVFKDKVDLMKVKPGDRIKVLFEEHYVKGKKVGTGNIVAAEINWQGKPFSAVRYVDAKGNADYYTPEGFSLKRGFTRHPVNYTHISSGFTHQRFDPILHRIARHEAIDFAAPAGTPIKATGDGKISFASNRGGYGNMVLIQHDRKYASLYAHMQRFATDIHPGTYVRQGQVIGFVGQTGMATGPHLHYEFHVNGISQNPLTVELPSAAPLSRLARARFIPQARQLIARLQGNQNMHLVENNHANTHG